MKTNTKSKFFSELVKNNNFNRREVVWILNYLIAKEELLSNFHFIHDFESFKNANRMQIVLTSNPDVFEIVFYNKENIMIKSYESIFKYIRANSDENFYVEIDFGGRDRQRSNTYFEILEDTAYESESDIFTDYVEHIIEKSLIEHNIQNLLEEIDSSLLDRKKTLFNKLSKRYAVLRNDLELVDGIISKLTTGDKVLK